MKGPRCQSCRYQACLDSGMYHSGVARQRGGRHGYSPIKQRSLSLEKYPTISTPNISAVMAATIANKDSSNISMDQSGASLEPADLVSVSMSPSEASEYNDEATANQNHSSNHVAQSQQSLQSNPSFFLQKSQIWEQFVSDNVKNEVDLLKSRTTIAETLLAEKTKQLDIVNRQVEMLKQRLLSADQLNKEQAITIESLKRRLGTSSNGRHSNGSNGNTSNGSSNDVKLPMVFENGGVTITPVVTSTSVMSSAVTSAVSNHSSCKSQNLLSHLLKRDNDISYFGHNSSSGGGDIATIEPVRESRGKS